jgi:transposase
MGLIDLFYGDESHVCTEGYVPYGWQFPGENVFIPCEKGAKINCFGLISRDNKCHFRTTRANIDAQFICDELENLSFQIRRPTFLVLDCARIHTSKIVQERIPFWQQRGLYLFFLPPYSPELNLAETLWRKVKKEWLKPEDYAEPDSLFYATNRCLASVGRDLSINFSPFNLN